MALQAAGLADGGGAHFPSHNLKNRAEKQSDLPCDSAPLSLITLRIHQPLPCKFLLHGFQNAPALGWGRPVAGRLTAAQPAPEPSEEDAPTPGRRTWRGVLLGGGVVGVGWGRVAGVFPSCPRAQSPWGCGVCSGGSAWGWLLPAGAIPGLTSWQAQPTALRSPCLETGGIALTHEKPPFQKPLVYAE